MAGWVTHLMIADALLERYPLLERRGFCVGNIAPDCNVESADWKTFTPPREVTHWMQGKTKTFADAERFREEYLPKRQADFCSTEQRAFLLGYYVHLLTDASYAAMLRENSRVQAAWERIRARPSLRSQSEGMTASWESVKKLVDKKARQREIEQLEAEYLRAHPQSGYWTEILPLQAFPDYLDYLPHGCIERKIKIMGTVPETSPVPPFFLALSREEFFAFIQLTVQLAAKKIKILQE